MVQRFSVPTSTHVPDVFLFRGRPRASRPGVWVVGSGSRYCPPGWEWGPETGFGFKDGLCL